ncbi:MAG: beta-propeller domain-containing protein [bacterium]
MSKNNSTLPEHDELLTEVLRQNKQYQKTKKITFWKFIFTETIQKLKVNPQFRINFAAVTTLLIVVVVLSVNGLSTLNKTTANKTFNLNNVDTFALEKFNSCQDIADKFNEFANRNKPPEKTPWQKFLDSIWKPTPKRNYANQVENQNLPIFRGDEDSVNKQQAPSTSAFSETSYSGTNNQVQGVQEGDIVQTDGNLIYTLNKNKLSVTSFNDGKLKLEVSVDINSQISDDYSKLNPREYINIRPPSSFTAKQLQLTGDKQTLILIGSSMGGPQGYGQTTVISFDLGSKGLQKILKEKPSDKIVNNWNYKSGWTLSGSLSQSRLIDSKLVLVNNSGTGFSQYSGNISKSQIESSVPTISEINSKLSQTGCDTINYVSPLTSISNYTSVFTLNFDEQSPKISTSTIVSSNQITYMSQRNLYLTQSNSNSTTTIFKFNSTQQGLKYQTSGKVFGTPLNQFSLDEYQDNLRIATNLSSTNNCSVSRTDQSCVSTGSGNFITVLDEDLKAIGRTQSLAQGERIYSVRFLGPKGYFVTFRQTDPLYTFDLSDPFNPKVTGELKIPGFSNYLHPVGDGYLLGIGQESDSQFGRGVKISLFDVRDPADPKEVDKKVIGLSGSSTLVQTDHKAFLWDAKRNLLSLPINVYTADDKSSSKLTFQGSYVYKIDFEKGLNLIGRISHIDYDKLQTQKVTVPSNSPVRVDENGQVIPIEPQNQVFVPKEVGTQQDLFINRQMYINNSLLTLSPSQLWSNSLPGLEKQSAVIF